MAYPFTIPEIIEIGDVGVGYCYNYQSNQALFGGAVIKPVPAVQVAIVHHILEWAYDAAQPASTQRNIGNYLIWMLGKFGLESQNALNGPGGGSVIPIPGGTTPNALDFTVTVSSPIADGQSTINLSQFIGYDVNCNYNYQPLYASAPVDGVSRWYSWNKITGDFALLNGAALLDDKIRIYI